MSTTYDYMPKVKPGQPFVSYIRVSTSKQSNRKKSVHKALPDELGLGQKAQQTAISNYISSVKGELVHEFLEVETGTDKRQRTVIYQALEYVRNLNKKAEYKKNPVKLIVSKVDRLTRSLKFAQELEQSKVEVLSCDNPTQSEVITDMFIMFGKIEGKLISQRTKAALAELKKEGVQLGNPDMQKLAQQAAEGRIKKAESNDNNKRALAFIKKTMKAGESFTMQSLADELNEGGYVTSTGKQFTSMQVKRLIDRITMIVAAVTSAAAVLVS
jgi:DNA invertase Pin-like site-specific DNA recombinase